MDEFEIGESAIYFRPGSDGHGDTVVIVDMLDCRWLDDGHGIDFVDCYLIVKENGNFAWNGRPYAAKPEWLRKKPKKRDIDQIVSWDDMPWRPEQIKQGVPVND